MRLSELYSSTQGEGPRVGLPTTFVRFAGCNLKCPLWPCDSQYAIDAENYRHEWEKVSAAELAEHTLDITPRGGNVCFTGGEPWLQNNSEMLELVDILQAHDRQMECFSNATLSIPDWAFGNQIQFVFDWKLPGSGETNFNPEVVRINLHRGFSVGCATLKFTVANWDDVDIALQRLAEMRKIMYVPDAYMGVAWKSALSEDELATHMCETEMVGVRLNVQVHKYIWEPDMRGI
jgi:7-carboxy-7-deazaguanine synthase